jgi:DNA adenine methylase
VRPLLSWPGGKSRLAKRLAAYLPPHRTYVEPFAGGAAVFFAKKPSKREVIGDKSTWATSFYRQVAKGGLRSCPIGTSVSRAKFQKLRRKGDPCSRFYTNKLSYHGNMKEMGPTERPRFAATALKNLPAIEGRLKHARIVTGDFAKTMRLGDSSDAVHFLDPPWPVGYTKNYAHKIPLLESVIKASEKMKGKVMVIYNDNGQVQRAFARRGWRRYRIHTTQGGGKRGAQKTTFLIATRGFRIGKKRR